jgi:hypothetical protein
VSHDIVVMTCSPRVEVGDVGKVYQSWVIGWSGTSQAPDSDQSKKYASSPGVSTGKVYDEPPSQPSVDKVTPSGWL